MILYKCFYKLHNIIRSNKFYYQIDIIMQKY